MKRVLILGLLLLSVHSYGQIVYKTDYEKATERMGVVYSINSQDVGELPYLSYQTNKAKATYRLDTFEDVNTKERVQGITIQFGKGLGAFSLGLNCSEIDDLIRAVKMIKDNHNLRYITKTANLRLKWGSTMMEMARPTDGSVPGDFQFSVFGYVNPDDMIKMLEDIKAVAD